MVRLQKCSTAGSWWQGAGRVVWQVLIGRAYSGARAGRRREERSEPGSANARSHGAAGQRRACAKMFIFTARVAARNVHAASTRVECSARFIAAKGAVPIGIGAVQCVERKHKRSIMRVAGVVRNPQKLASLCACRQQVQMWARTNERYIEW